MARARAVARARDVAGVTAVIEAGDMLAGRGAVIEVGAVIGARAAVEARPWLKPSFNWSRGCG